MRPHQQIMRQLSEAQSAGRCITAASHADRLALLRRVQTGHLVKPYRGIFADAEYWQTLNPASKVMHLARTLTSVYPSWVFAGPTAAAIHGLEHQWSIHELGLHIADSHNGAGVSNQSGLRRVYMADIPRTIVHDIPVTSAARTVVDCGSLLPFRRALPVIDSALARRMTSREAILDVCAGLHGSGPVKRLLRYADPLSENGGESLMRGTMVEEGIADPVLQHVFRNPANPEQWYRADFAWFLPGGRVVVAEYDGMGKYVDPRMTARKTIQEIVSKQSQRERDLLAWGVNAIVRIGFDDVIRRFPMVDKLTAVGVPRYERKEWADWDN